jgi:hypothetical protein
MAWHLSIEKQRLFIRMNRIAEKPRRWQLLSDKEKLELELAAESITENNGHPLIAWPDGNFSTSNTFYEAAKVVMALAETGQPTPPPEQKAKPTLKHAQVALVGFYRGLNLRYSKHATFIDENYRALLTEFKHEPTRGAIGKNYNGYFSKIAIDKEGRIIGMGKFGYKKTINDIKAVLPHLTETQKEAAKKDIAKLEELKEKEPK